MTEAGVKFSNSQLPLPRDLGHFTCGLVSVCLPLGLPQKQKRISSSKHLKTVQYLYVVCKGLVKDVSQRIIVSGTVGDHHTVHDVYKILEKKNCRSDGDFSWGL